MARPKSRTKLIDDYLAHVFGDDEATCAADVVTEHDVEAKVRSHLRSWLRQREKACDVRARISTRETVVDALLAALPHRRAS